MILGQVFSPNTINLNLESTEKDEVFEELVENFISVYSESKRVSVLSAVLEREDKLSTGIGKGFAVPHGICNDIEGVKGFIGISRSGIDFDSLYNKPVHIIFMMVSGSKDTEYHLQVMKRLALILNTSGIMENILSKKTSQEVFDTLIHLEKIITATN